MEREAAEAEAEIESNSERIMGMGEHLRNVQQEEKMTESVAAARQKEIESESQIALLASRERSKLEVDAKRIQAEIARLADNQNAYQNDIFKFQAEIDELRQQMDWDESKLQEWLEEARQQEEDAEILDKYVTSPSTRMARALVIARALRCVDAPCCAFPLAKIACRWQVTQGYQNSDSQSTVCHVAHWLSITGTPARTSRGSRNSGCSSRRSRSSRSGRSTCWTRR